MYASIERLTGNSFEWTQMTKVLAIVPAYNEEESIGLATEDLVKNAPEIDYVVVNDGSNDSTEKVCLERGYNVISLPDHFGLTGAFPADDGVHDHLRFDSHDHLGRGT